MRTQRKPVRALDKLDRRILDLLQKDGRLSMKELSEAVGLTITPCIERVKRLEREHFILGYYARLNPAMLGASLLVFVEISLGSKSGNMFEQFRREEVERRLHLRLLDGCGLPRVGEVVDVAACLGWWQGKRCDERRPREQRHERGHARLRAGAPKGGAPPVASSGSPCSRFCSRASWR